jgi:hypothetical protein
LTEAVDYVKTELMPDFDFDAFNHDEVAGDNEGGETSSPVQQSSPVAENVVVNTTATADAENPSSGEEVDKW